jgi:hypothetical protein
MKFSIGSLLAAAALTAFVAAPAAARTTVYAGPTDTNVGAAATFIDIDLAGWQAFGAFGRPNNTQVFVSVGAGNTVLGFDYSNLSFTTEGGSWLSELTLSINSTDGETYMDWSPSVIDDAGTLGPLAGSWGGTEGAAGPFGAGGSFSAADGQLWITVYEGFDDPFGDTGLVRDAVIASGTMRVYLASPIPEPGTYGMMALGLLAVGAVMRKRQQAH